MNKKKEKLIKETDNLVKKAIKKIDDHPEVPQNYYNLGVLLTELKNYEQAQELYIKALYLFKKNKEAADLLHYGSGNVFYAAGLYEKAVKEFQRVTGSSLKQEAYLMLAQTEFAQDHYQQAVAFALTVAEKEEKSIPALMLLGESFLALGNFETAKKYFEKVVNYEPAHFKANFELGVLELVSGGKGTAYFQCAQGIDAQAFAAMKTRLVDIERVVAARKKGGKKSN
ncbi:tetratricopeptide repeat protein [Liquorilactobacillus oeni]|uniref:Uncharacterized protein n=1 Tax=Liquorilactobacillus oeni DSM 19972 TaxID=1423777 RepID=A0A0R1M969_9LACO|nr:tetratricopeptide repeat protein [Liquorilactobacillus oeni]KRL04652.1 hypothetical protein FD46_GL001786 [Liquorilactobacillus oeni DSM 19972]